jgi:hypothetical protein
MTLDILDNVNAKKNHTSAFFHSLGGLTPLHTAAFVYRSSMAVQPGLHDQRAQRPHRRDQEVGQK